MLTKLFVFLFILAIVIMLREAYNFGWSYKHAVQYLPTRERRISLIIAIAVFFTLIVTGFGL